MAAGLPWGWLALALVPVAWRFRGRLRPQLVGLAGMAALGLLACTVRGLEPYWHFRRKAGGCDLGLSHADARLGRLLAACRGGHLVGGVAADAARRGGAAASADPHGGRLGAGGGNSRRAAGVEGGFLATYREQLWAAAAIAVASVAGATMAVWRRREGWAFAAALGVNVAASLVVWHFELVAHRWRIGGCGWSRPTSSPARRWPWPGWRRGDASISSTTSRSARARCWRSRSHCRRPAAWRAGDAGRLAGLQSGGAARVDRRPGHGAGLDRPAGGRGRRRLVSRHTLSGHVATCSGFCCWAWECCWPVMPARAGIGSATMS